MHSSYKGFASCQIRVLLPIILPQNLDFVIFINTSAVVEVVDDSPTAL